MLYFGVFLRESAPTAAKSRANLSSHRRSCRKPLDRSGPNLKHVCRFIWEWTSAKQINLSSPEGYLDGVRGHTYRNVGNMPNRWADRVQIWHTYAYSSGNGHELNKYLHTRGAWGLAGLGGHQFIHLGKLPNGWNDRDQIWRTYTDTPGNGHMLTKFAPRAPRGLWSGQGVTNLKMWEIDQTAVPIRTTFGTRMHIHLGMDMS